MLGAIAGDIIGSVYEFANTKSTEFDLFTPWSTFTDDTVMTLAVAKWLVEDEAHTLHYLIYCMQELGNRYPNAGYGGNFCAWLREDEPQPYNSWGNGAGMRVSHVGLYAKTLDEALALAAITASVSHDTKGLSLRVIFQNLKTPEQFQLRTLGEYPTVSSH